MNTDGEPVAKTKHQSYRAAAAMGGVWAVLQLLFAKCSAAISTFAFAYLLEPESVGIAASGLAIVSLLLVFPPPVISDVLVRFGHDLGDWIAAGRRLSRIVAVTSLASIVATGAVMGLATDHKAMGLVVALLGVRAFFESLSYPPLSRMRVALKFRQIAAIDTLIALTVMVAGIVYAWLTRRPEAVVIGFVAGAVVRAIAFGIAAGPRDEPAEPKGQFPTLFKDFRGACLGHYVYALVLVADRFVLTLFCSDRVVGIYYFAFMLSTQVNAAISLALAVVVQPILGHLRDDPQRQLRAFKTVCGALAAVTIPVMVAQAALTRLFFELVLPTGYADSAPVLEVLSIAMCFCCCMGPCLAMLTAQSRFRAYLGLQVAQLVMLVAFISTGAALGGEERGGLYAALGVLGVYLMFGPFAFWLAGQRADLAADKRLQAGESIGIFLRPFVMGLLAFAPAAYVANADLGLSSLARATAAVATAVACCGIYLLLLRAFARSTWSDLCTETLAIVERVRRRRMGTSDNGHQDEGLSS
ncbi:MAG: oligosaccharide flippase family protein [bacterium]|jgi:O-antigen/teichoic acid export membrane protein